MQLQSKYIREKQDCREEKETGENNREAKLRETNAELKTLDAVRVNELEQENENLKEIRRQLLSDKKMIDKELESSKKKLVKAVRGKQSLKDENENFCKQIKKLERMIKQLKTTNSDLMTNIDEHGTSEYENLKAERDKLSSDNKRLRNEVEKSQSNCRTLEGEIMKWRNAVSRKY